MEQKPYPDPSAAVGAAAADLPVHRLAAAAIKIDPQARSSMWQDLGNRRPTEFGDLKGTIVALAARWGITAPGNARIAAAIAKAEAAGEGSPRLDGDR